MFSSLGLVFGPAGALWRWRPPAGLMPRNLPIDCWGVLLSSLEEHLTYYSNKQSTLCELTSSSLIMSFFTFMNFFITRACT